MSKKHKKFNNFNNVWSNQTDIGKHFNLSGIAVGKILIEHGLKDPDTKEATDKALKEGYAKSKPLQDGTPYFLWNKDKVKPLIKVEEVEISKVDLWTDRVKKTLKYADRLFNDGQDKVAYLTQDSAFDNVPKDILKEVEAKIEIWEQSKGNRNQNQFMSKSVLVKKPEPKEPSLSNLFDGGYDKEESVEDKLAYGDFNF